MAATGRLTGLGKLRRPENRLKLAAYMTLKSALKLVKEVTGRERMDGDSGSARRSKTVNEIITSDSRAILIHATTGTGRAS